MVRPRLTALETGVISVFPPQASWPPQNSPVPSFCWLWVFLSIGQIFLGPLTQYLTPGTELDAAGPQR